MRGIVTIKRNCCGELQKTEIFLIPQHLESLPLPSLRRIAIRKFAEKDNLEIVGSCDHGDNVTCSGARSIVNSATMFTLEAVCADID